MKKRIAAAVLACSLVVSLAGCGSSSSSSDSSDEAEDSSTETLTGTAEGFGGDVTVTLTMDGDTITACSIDGPDETEDVGGAALDELAEQVVAANGSEIDGVSGATVTSTAVKEAVAAALGEEVAEEETEEEEATEEAEEETEEETAEEEVEEEAAEEETEEETEEASSGSGNVQMGVYYGMSESTDSFAVAVVLVEDDVILDAYMDEFQVMEVYEEGTIEGVPNSDAGFGENYADGYILASKLTNDDYYSNNMVEYASATLKLSENYAGIEEYTIGKTADEVNETADLGEEAVDAVSGATLTGTHAYLSLIASAAEAATETEAVAYDGDTSDLSIQVAYGAPHGEDCWGIAAVITDGENIILSYIDEFQFTDSTADVEGVPNSDSDLATGFVDGVILISKRVNTEYYSQLMVDYAEATVAIDANYDAIQDYVNGMSIDDVVALSESDDAVDQVTGATLEDTAGYVALIAEAAQQ